MSQKVEIEIRLDNKHFAEGANAVKMEISALSRHAASEGEKMGGIFDGLGKKVAGAFAVSKLVEFEKKIIDVRGEMESLRISFETLAGEHIGRQLYEDIKQFTTTTPMMMNDLAKGAQTLLGFNIEAEKVMPILRQIGDISMGDAQKFNSLTLAFAQTSSTGKLMGQDLLQMINAGFNPLVVISEKTGKSVAKLKEEMSQGAITVEMVEDAFRTATAEGGKFHGMLEKQSKGIKGAVSNLQGALQDMLNDIGEKQQDFMVDGAKLATTLVQNYEKVGQVLLGLVTTYGTYKAAVIAVTLAETTANGQRMITVKWLRLQAAAQALLNKTMLANPYVLAATALAVLVGAIIAARDGLTDAERAQRDYNKTLEEAKRKQEEYNNETQEAINKAKDDSVATEEREQAMQTLINRYPEIIKKYIDEKGHLTDILNLHREIAAYDRMRANEDNRINADLYRRYVEILKKQQRGQSLTQTESILYQGARKRYNDATPWYNRVFSNRDSWISGAVDYFKNLEEKANYTYGRGNTQAKMNSFLEKLGEMETKDLEALKETISTATKNVEGHKAVLVKQVGDYLERTDLDAIATKIDGIITARNKPKEEVKDKKKPKTDHTAEDEAKRRQKQFELDMAEENEQSKRKVELRDALRDLEIANEQDNAKRELMQMQKDHEDKLEAIREQADQWKKEAYKAAEERWNATNKDKTKTFADTDEGKAGWQAQSLTPEQEQTIQARVNAENAIYNRGIKERMDAERQALLDYLKQYGTYEERRLAITKNYEKKIKEARTQGEKASLKQQSEKELKELKETFEKGINWEEVFDDLKSIPLERLVQYREELKKMLSDNNIDAQNAKIVSERLLAIDTEIASKKSLWRRIISSTIPELDKIYQREEREKQKQEQINLLEQKKIELLKEEARIKKEILNLANDDGIDLDEQDVNAGNADHLLQYYKNSGGTNVSQFQNLLQGLLQNNANQGNNQQALSSFGGAGGGEGGGSYAESIAAVAAVFEEINGYVQELNRVVQDFKDSDPEFAKQMQEFAKGSQYANDAVQNLKNNDYIGATIDTIGVFKSLYENMQAIGIFGGADKHESIAKELDTLSRAINSATKAIDHWSEELEKSYGAIAIKNAEKQKELLLKQQEIMIDGLDLALQDNYGGGHSDYYHWEKNTGDVARDIAAKYGLNMNTGDGIWSWNSLFADNDPKEVARVLKEIRENDVELWQLMQTQGYNEGAVGEWLDQLADSAEQLEEAEEKLKERLTTTTSEDVFDGFLNSLYELADGADDVFEDIEQDWQKMVNKMVINNFVAKQFEDKLKLWYEDLAQLQKDKEDTWDETDESQYKKERERLLQKIKELENDNHQEGGIFGRWITGSEYHKDEIEELLKQIADLDKVAQEARNKEPISDEEYQRRLEKLKAQYQQWVAEGKDSVEFFREMGLIQAIDEVAEHFGDLRSKFLDTLMDMEFDAEEWKKELNKKLVQDLLEKQVFDVKMTVNGQDFDNFDAYAKDWNKRYLEALEAGDEAALQALIDELVQQRELLAEASEDLTSRLKETVEDTTFRDMSDSWVSTLMDMNATAEDWAQNIGQIMVQKIVEQLIAPSMLQPLLDGLQGAFNTAMSADGATWDSVVGDAGVQEWLNKIKETFPEAQNIVRQIMDSLGLITAEGLGNIKDNFVSALTDINKTAEDLGKDIANTMYSQMVDKFVDSKYGEELKSLSDEWAEALKSGDTAKIEELRQKIIALYETIGNDESIKQLLDDLNKLNTEAGSTPFDNLRSSYLSAVMDMEKTTKDFTKDIMQMIAESFVDSFVLGTAFDEKLKQWKEEYREITSDNSLSETERLRQLKSLGELIAGERDTMRTEANNIMTMLGLNQGGTDSATMNMADKATYDQFELYLGIANSQLMVSEQHKQIAQQILSRLESMNGITSPDSVSYGERIYTRLGTTNEYLLATKNYVRDILAEMANIKQSLNRL